MLRVNYRAEVSRFQLLRSQFGVCPRCGYEKIKQELDKKTKLFRLGGSCDETANDEGLTTKEIRDFDYFIKKW